MKDYSEVDDILNQWIGLDDFRAEIKFPRQEEKKIEEDKKCLMYMQNIKDDIVKEEVENIIEKENEIAKTFTQICKDRKMRKKQKWIEDVKVFLGKKSKKEKDVINLFMEGQQLLMRVRIVQMSNLIKESEFAQVNKLIERILNRIERIREQISILKWKYINKLARQQEVNWINEDEEIVEMKMMKSSQAVSLKFRMKREIQKNKWIQNKKKYGFWKKVQKERNFKEKDIGKYMKRFQEKQKYVQDENLAIMYRYIVDKVKIIEVPKKKVDVEEIKQIDWNKWSDDEEVQKQDEQISEDQEQRVMVEVVRLSPKPVNSYGFTQEYWKEQQLIQEQWMRKFARLMNAEFKTGLNDSFNIRISKENKEIFIEVMKTWKHKAKELLRWSMRRHKVRKKRWKDELEILRSIVSANKMNMMDSRLKRECCDQV